MSSRNLIAGPGVGGEADPSAIRVAPPEPLRLDTTNYPWISESSADIPVVGVTLPDGTVFRYGSLVGLSNTVRKVADRVPEPAATTAQSNLFAALPHILRGRRHPGIGKVETSRPNAPRLFSSNRNIIRAARLIFAVEQTPDDGDPPVVLRAGISVPRDHNRLMKALNVGTIGVAGHKRTKRA